jgi:hypothetical protein
LVAEPAFLTLLEMWKADAVFRVKTHVVLGKSVSFILQDQLVVKNFAVKHPRRWDNLLSRKANNTSPDPFPL